MLSSALHQDSLNGQICSRLSVPFLISSFCDHSFIPQFSCPNSCFMKKEHILYVVDRKESQSKHSFSNSEAFLLFTLVVYAYVWSAYTNAISIFRVKMSATATQIASSWQHLHASKLISGENKLFSKLCIVLAIQCKSHAGTCNKRMHGNINRLDIWWYVFERRQMLHPHA